MKKLFVIAAIATAAATGASAMVDADVNIKKIENYAGGADVSNLTDGEILVLLNAIHSGDTESEKRNFVRGFVAKNG